MPLSPTMVAELKRSAVALRTELALLEQLLQLYGAEPPVLPTADAGEESGDGDEAQPEGVGESTGLRAAILRVLEASGKKLRPNEVTQALLASGWKSNAKTPVGPRVAGELSRMVKEQKAGRTNGRYFVGVETAQDSLEDLL